MTGPTDRSEDNVPQEQVQDNPNWGRENKLPEEDGQEYWEEGKQENDESQ